MNVNPPLFIELKVPAWVTREQIKGANEDLVEIMDTMKKSANHQKALVGFLAAARIDGYPVQGIFADLDDSPALIEKLEELCMRAFWWKFEKIAEERRPSATVSP